MWFKNRTAVPGEVVFEVIQKDDAVGFGYAVADIERSREHYHRVTLEVYTLIEGRAAVHLGNETVVLSRRGDNVTVPVGVHHWVETLSASPARIGVHTFPAWTQEDQILV